ncbi:flagellar type III secretion system protein FliR [candidate division GN15 bacterium]|nr:flagellar type III secretion system protein FliR [candidate division GN15 bacterium]
MFDFVQYGTARLELFLLVLVRASGIFILSPIFSHRSITRPVKAGLVLLLTIITMMTIPAVSAPVTDSLIGLAGLLFLEMLVGVLIGFMFLLILLATQGAGSMVGYQIGFALANVLDPSTNQQSSIIGTFWMMLATVIFLTLNGHHMVIQAFHDSYTVMPPGEVALHGGIGEAIIRHSAYVFVIALKIAAPVMVTLFLVDVSLGTVAKMMPQMNVFFVGFPIKVAAGLAVVALSLPIFAYVIEKSLNHLNTELGRLLLAMGRA